MTIRSRPLTLVSIISRGVADGAVVDQGADQPVDRVAAVVLGDRDDLPGPLRRLHDDVAAAQGDRQRLLAAGRAGRPPGRPTATM